jgi:hypothetical protein
MENNLYFYLFLILTVIFVLVGAFQYQAYYDTLNMAKWVYRWDFQKDTFNNVDYLEINYSYYDELKKESLDRFDNIDDTLLKGQLFFLFGAIFMFVSYILKLSKSLDIEEDLKESNEGADE